MGKKFIIESNLKELTRLEESLKVSREITSKLGIEKPENDSGYKTAQILLGLKSDLRFSQIQATRGKYGDDAWIPEVREKFEIKSLEPKGECISLAKFKQFRLSSHVSENTILRYERSEFIFGIFHKGVVCTIYWVEPIYLQCYFNKWKEELDKTGEYYVKSPSIDVSLIVSKGELVFERPRGLLFK